MSSTLKYLNSHNPRFFISSIVLDVEHVHILCGVDGRSVVHPYYLGPITATGNLAQLRRFCCCCLILMTNVLHLSKGLQNFTHPRTDAVVIMIAIDETGDKVLLGRAVRQTVRRLILNILILYRRKGFPHFIRLWLGLSNQLKHLKMQFPERCGKKLGFAFGM